MPPLNRGQVCPLKEMSHRSWGVTGLAEGVQGLG